MRRGKDAARMARPLEERAPDLPDLRREIIIIDHDFGERMHRLAKKLAVLDLARMVGHRDLRQLMIYYNESAEDIAGRIG